MLGSAEFSDCGWYRYTLSREWLTGEGTVLFVMLNPSTATAEQLDPTVTRCLKFAQRWGYRRLLVGNIFAFRATDPSDLPEDRDPVGPANDRWLREMASDADYCVAAWGSHSRLSPATRVRAVARSVEVLDLLADMTVVHALLLADNGQPRHPLYVRADVTSLVLQPLRSLALPVDSPDVAA